MVKTQIQLPEELYRQVKEFAARREWSLAETFRRGVEELMQVFPAEPEDPESWTLPEPRVLGCFDLDDDELKRLAREDPSAESDL